MNERQNISQWLFVQNPYTDFYHTGAGLLMKFLWNFHEISLEFLGLFNFLLNKYSWKFKSLHKSPCKSPYFRSGKIENRIWGVASAVDYLDHYTRASSEASVYILIINTMAFFSSLPPPLPSRKAQVTVIQRVDSGVHQINHYFVDKHKGIQLCYPLDSDLSGGKCYPPFEQLEPSK